MRTANRVNKQQALLFMNMKYGHSVKQLEINYGAGARIEFFANDICVGSWVERFNMLEYKNN